MRAGRGPLQHGQITVGVPGGEDRALPYVDADRDWLLRTVVEDLKAGSRRSDFFIAVSVSAWLDGLVISASRGQWVEAFWADQPTPPS